MRITSRPSKKYLITNSKISQTRSWIYKLIRVSIVAGLQQCSILGGTRCFFIKKRNKQPNSTWKRTWTWVSGCMTIFPTQLVELNSLPYIGNVVAGVSNTLSIPILFFHHNVFRTEFGRCYKSSTTIFLAVYTDPFDGPKAEQKLFQTGPMCDDQNIISLGWPLWGFIPI